MAKYTIFYSFDGSGEVDIEADTEDEAEEKFYEGDFSNENEKKSNNYVVEDIVEIEEPNF